MNPMLRARAASKSSWGRLLTTALPLGLFLMPPDAFAAFRYADAVTTTGGQFNANYPPTNLINSGFNSATNTIDTRGDYLAAGNNYATASGTTANFNLTFNFNTPESLTAMYVWNYVYRNGVGGSGSTNNGVNAYTLTFFTGINGTGSVVGTFSGNLSRAVWNALNPAEVVNFGITNPGVRSVVMHVASNHGSGGFTGMNELAFEALGAAAPPAIISFTASSNVVAAGSVATLSWQVGTLTNLTIDNGIGDVLSRTTNGIGSIEVYPTNGFVNYTLTANGVESQWASIIGLPPKEKLHVYLLIGQSNMQGAGTPFDPALDAAHPRILQFGSRDGLESVFALAQHPLTSLNAGAGAIGMGLEFARTMLASNSDPSVVICLINHALGATAIQWWQPGAGVSSFPTRNYRLYDEAVQRAQAAAAFGTIKGVLWHQGEYNCNTNNSNPAAEPELYAQRLNSLVDNLRADFEIPDLPFVCGQLVPRWTNATGTIFSPPTLHRRDLVEAALQNLRNQRAHSDCVENTGLRGREDEVIHFDAASQRELGRRYAQKLLAIGSNQTPPSLGYRIVSGQLELSWPLQHVGWALQIRTNSLVGGPNINWNTISNSQNSNLYLVPLDFTSSPIFFRLRQP